MKKVLVTSALPYANGPIHLGHMVEYIQTDIYVRFLKSCGLDAIYLCADDTHGTPIEINARKNQMTPEAFTAKFYDEHQRDFADFDVVFDCFGSTHSAENRHTAELIYRRLKSAGEIDRREVEQTYCDKDRRFLPDRFVRGKCPNCKSEDQYGDVCEKCGKTYAPTDLIEPRCALCGQAPVRRKSAHLFFRLSRHQDFLAKLVQDGRFLHPQVSGQLKAFFEKGLADWDISRDGPYFGFPIPDEEDKFFYVWLDAPIGYLSTTERWAKPRGRDALEYWGEQAESEIVHFIGKDIVYFHALFWPAVLRQAGFKIPDRLVVHGHLTIDGEKMSKSRGTVIPARAYLGRLDPSYLRYFYAANLGPGPEDLDLSFKDFRARVNGELVNNIGNLANRALSLLADRLEGRLSAQPSREGGELLKAAIERTGEVRAAFERLDFRVAVRAIAQVAQQANQLMQTAAPWKLAADSPEQARSLLSDIAELLALVGAWLAPVVPRISERLFAQLGVSPVTFEDLAKKPVSLLDRKGRIGVPSPLIARIEAEQIDGLVASPAIEPAGGREIAYEDFAKVVLKVGKVLSAERIPKADKLLKLSVDLAEGEPRTIAAGIAEAYQPDQLVGRSVVVVANLKPRSLKGVSSRGMLLASDGEDGRPRLVDPGPVPPGTQVK